MDEALAIYKEVTAKSPDYTQGHYRLAEIMLMRGEVDGARNEIANILKNDAKDRQAMILRARMQAGRSESSHRRFARGAQAGTEFAPGSLLHG